MQDCFAANWRMRIILGHTNNNWNRLWKHARSALESKLSSLNGSCQLAAQVAYYARQAYLESVIAPHCITSRSAAFQQQGKTRSKISCFWWILVQAVHKNSVENWLVTCTTFLFLTPPLSTPVLMKLSFANIFSFKSPVRFLQSIFLISWWACNCCTPFFSTGIYMRFLLFKTHDIVSVANAILGFSW